MICWPHFKNCYEEKNCNALWQQKYTRQEISIETRMTEIMVELNHLKGKKNFNDLFPIPAKEHIVVTFLAVLELIKRKEIDVEQHENFGDIFVDTVEEGEKELEIINWHSILESLLFAAGDEGLTLKQWQRS